MEPKQVIFRSYETQLDYIIAQTERAKTVNLAFDALITYLDSAQEINYSDASNLYDSLAAYSQSDVDDHQSIAASVVDPHFRKGTIVFSSAYDSFRFGSSPDLQIEGMVVNSHVARLQPPLLRDSRAGSSEHDPRIQAEYDVLKIVLSPEGTLHTGTPEGVYVAKHRQSGNFTYFKVVPTTGATEARNKYVAANLSSLEQEELKEELVKAASTLSA